MLYTVPIMAVALSLTAASFHRKTSWRSRRDNLTEQV